ncbi:DciA family protein [Demequina capsici]|uniref:DciA family protein n=1 Tax=Demequina capsici TaxID=3075620 RepID=A0AA96FAT5_9MICO|nr:DciA family protein [Demequina sp. PMTSA13]WNM27321.1 DciA family protein [Demequina sp. PMTSA13]
MADDEVEPAADLEDAPLRSAQDIAREAMQRARESARERGARVGSPRAARRDRHLKREQTDRDALPYGKGRDPQPMSDAVAALMRRMGWAEQIEITSVTARWREVVGDQIADRCEPLGFEDGVLTVKASTTAWATQLTLMKGQLTHRLNEEFGRDLVKDLKVLGPTARSWTKGRRTVKGRGPRDTYG